MTRYYYRLHMIPMNVGIFVPNQICSARKKAGPLSVFSSGWNHVCDDFHVVFTCMPCWVFFFRASQPRLAATVWVRITAVSHSRVPFPPPCLSNSRDIRTHISYFITRYRACYSGGCAGFRISGGWCYSSTKPLFLGVAVYNIRKSGNASWQYATKFDKRWEC